MQLQRLWQTLTYFEVFPIFNCVQKLFNPTTKKSFNIKMNYILLSNFNSELAKETLKFYLEKKVNIKVITTENIPNDNNNLLKIDESVRNINQEKSYLLQGVKTFICFPEEGINNLINLINQNLQPSEILLFNFTKPQVEIKEIWGAVDDVVMGGVSASNLTLANNKAIFSGMVSTDNNGGFASVRCKNFTPPWDLSGYAGIRLKVKGDGKRYKFITRCEGKWDGISYCYSFDTVADTWITVDIPFSQLIPVFRAKTLLDADKFDCSKIYSLQLMLSKFEYDGAYNPHFQAGSFILEIESIKAYGGEDTPQLVLMGNANEWQNFPVDTSLLKIYGENIEDLTQII